MLRGDGDMAARATGKGLRILVILRQSEDVRVPPQCDARSGRVRHEWQVTEVYPPDARGLDIGLALKAAHPATTVCLLQVAPPQAEPWLREGLGRGCDEAVRLWDEELAGVGPAGEAAVLAAGASAIGFDLILLGGASEAAPSDQTALVMAARLGVPCVTQVLAPEPSAEPGWLRLTRGLEAGYEERAEVRLPAVLAVGGQGGEALAPLPALLRAQAATITAYDPADLGLAGGSLRAAEGVVERRGPLPPRPGLRRVAAPDSALPAFERIQQLLQGTTRRREGRVVRGTSAELAEEIFQVLLREGWLDHLKRETPRAPSGPAGPTSGAGE